MSTVVCDKIFECPGWEKSYRQLNDAVVFCHTQTAAPKYTGVPFKFCPWCGKEIKWHEWERSIVNHSSRQDKPAT